MIGYLRGRLLVKRPNQAIVDVGGVGYELTIPVSTFSSLPAPGEEVVLHVYTYLREDTLALYGFGSEDEKLLFEKLIAVGGIGPRLAVSILSGLPLNELIDAIRLGAVDRLIRIPGVGRKTAERMVVELRDKLEGFGRPAVTEAVPATAWTPVESDVISALLNLGCPRPAAEKAVERARHLAPQEFEPLFRQALEFVR